MVSNLNALFLSFLLKICHFLVFYIIILCDLHLNQIKVKSECSTIFYHKYYNCLNTVCPQLKVTSSNRLKIKRNSSYNRDGTNIVCMPCSPINFHFEFYRRLSKVIQNLTTVSHIAKEPLQISLTDEIPYKLQQKSM